MAYNVLGKRRFCCCDKGIAKQFQQQQKCGGAKHHKGRSPTGVLRSLAPKGRTFTVCYTTLYRTPY